MQVVRGFGMRAYDMQAEDHPQGHIWVASKVPCSPVVAVDVSDNACSMLDVPRRMLLWAGVQTHTRLMCHDVSPPPRRVSSP